MGPYDELVPFDGKLERPMLTMHGTGDLFVPIFLEQTLKRAVVAAGKESLLAQRVYRIAGHCGFSQPEMIKAFDDLTTWVHKGTKPEGDEVLRRPEQRRDEVHRSAAAERSGRHPGDGGV